MLAKTYHRAAAAGPFTGGVLFVLIAALGAAPALAQPAAGGELPRTAWGDPDLQGVWDFRSLTPMERPPELAGKATLTAEEAAVFIDASPYTNWDDRSNPEGRFGLDTDIEHGYNQFWMDFGTDLTADRRTSLVVDPPDGRIPWIAGAERPGGYGDAFSGTLPDGPEDRPLAERCLMGFNSGPPMLPSAYNNSVQIFQTPERVVVFNEMINSARIIPMGGEPHLPPRIRQWIGDSRGRWEGDTLVIETSNFLRETHFEGSSANLHLVERFRRVGPGELAYEFTAADPNMWTSPWTALIPMTKTDGRIFEYACHEGNYGMFNMLAGARVQEQAEGR
ncbi:MAG: hypothetical protein OXF27_00035 [Acidobacteria bacterium]|nr:hypothetical protein [Acidobacteriota bacterium]